MAIQQGARRLLRKAAISDGGLEMEKLNVAIADDNEKMIEKDTVVEIERIEGVKLIVKKKG